MSSSKRTADQATIDDTNRPAVQRRTNSHQVPQGDIPVHAPAEQASAQAYNPDLPLPSIEGTGAAAPPPPLADAQPAPVPVPAPAPAPDAAARGRGRGKGGRGSRGGPRGAGKRGSRGGQGGEAAASASTRVNQESQAAKNSQKFRAANLPSAKRRAPAAAPAAQAARVAGSEDHPMMVDNDVEMGAGQVEGEGGEQAEQGEQGEQAEQSSSSSRRRGMDEVVHGGDDDLLDETVEEGLEGLEGSVNPEAPAGQKKQRKQRRKKHERERNHSDYVRGLRGENGKTAQEEVQPWIDRILDMEARGEPITKEVLATRPSHRTGQSCDRCVSLKLPCDPLPFKCANCRIKQADCMVTDRNTEQTYRRSEILIRGRELQAARAQLQGQRENIARLEEVIRFYERCFVPVEQRINVSAFVTYGPPMQPLHPMPQPMQTMQPMQGNANDPRIVPAQLDPSMLGGSSDGFAMQGPSLQASYAASNAMAGQPMVPGLSSHGQVPYPQMGMTTAFPPTNQFAGNQGTDAMNVPGRSPYQGGPGANMRPSRAQRTRVAIPHSSAPYAIQLGLNEATYPQQESTPSSSLSRFQGDVDYLRKAQQNVQLQASLGAMDFTAPLENLRPRQDPPTRSYARPARSVQPQQGAMSQQDMATGGYTQPARPVQQRQEAAALDYAQPSQVPQPSIPGHNPANPAGIINYNVDINPAEGSGLLSNPARPYVPESSTTAERTTEGYNPQQAPGIEGQRELNEGPVQEGPSAVERADFDALFMGGARNDFDAAFEEEEQYQNTAGSQALDPARFTRAQGQGAEVGTAPQQPQLHAAGVEASHLGTSTSSSQPQGPISYVPIPPTASHANQPVETVAPRSTLHYPSEPAPTSPPPPALATVPTQRASSQPLASTTYEARPAEPAEAESAADAGDQNEQALAEPAHNNGFDGDWNQANLQTFLGGMTFPSDKQLEDLPGPKPHEFDAVNPPLDFPGLEASGTPAKESSSSDDKAQDEEDEDQEGGEDEQSEEGSEKDAEFEADDDYLPARPEGPERQEEARSDGGEEEPWGPKVPTTPALPPVSEVPVIGNPEDYEDESQPLFPGIPSVDLDDAEGFGGDPGDEAPEEDDEVPEQVESSDGDEDDSDAESTDSLFDEIS